MGVRPGDESYPQDAAAGTPLPLDYFASHEPERRRARAVTLWSVVLLAGWGPYLCGIVNTMAIAVSYSPPVIASHLSGAILFMGLGVVASIASLVRFVQMRHLTGSCAAGTILLLQLSVAACIGLGR